jgi:hypothetical protein
MVQNRSLDPLRSRNRNQIQRHTLPRLISRLLGHQKNIHLNMFPVLHLDPYCLLVPCFPDFPLRPYLHLDPEGLLLRFDPLARLHPLNQSHPLDRSDPSHQLRLGLPCLHLDHLAQRDPEGLLVLVNQAIHLVPFLQEVQKILPDPFAPWCQRFR